MSTAVSNLELVPAYVSAPPPKDLPCDDGVPLETHWHFIEIALLQEIVTQRLRHRNDFYVGGNMFIYYNADQARNQDVRGPDFFYVDGVPREPMRKYWAVWDEGGHYPNLIVELLSASTAKFDRTVKKDIYQNVFRTHEYFLYDPESKVLEGFRLGQHLRYEPIAAKDGRLWSDQLQGWLGLWDGKCHGHHATWVRLFDERGQPFPTPEEAAQQEIARLQAQLSTLEGKT